MLDRLGKVLYVGKAKNLHSRVGQYFVPGRDTRPQVPLLVAKVAKVDTIVVQSEKEALLLEDTLIKEHRPPYNIQLKDDKSYIALQVRTKSPWPMVNLVRLKGEPKDKNLYFGPYTSALAARDTLEEIRRLFPLRQCSDKEFARRTRPCILYQMKRCIAPCVAFCTKDEYEKEVEQTIRFLKGDTSHVLKVLWSQLKAASDALEYERAAVLLHKIRQIEKTLEGQKVNLLKKGDFDIWGLWREGDEGDLAILSYRSGKLLGVTHYPFHRLVQEDSELIETALLQYYKGVREVPKEIIVPEKLTKGLEELLNSTIVVPTRGQKKALVLMAKENAEAHFKQYRDKKEVSERTLLQLQEVFELKQYPHRIDCFDTANMAGSSPTASLITYVEGELDKGAGRTYTIKTTEGEPDDYQAMREVMLRRYQKANAEELPNLIIVDGGKGQLSIAHRVLKELNITTIDLIALTKEEAKHTKGLTQERVFLLDRKDPIHLGKHSAVLFFLQRIRDEAHRRAIGLHKKQRSKKLLKSQLDDIVGIGPIKKKRLLSHFGSVKRVFEASDEELLSVKGMTLKDIERIRQAFP